jgi:hypothetical protein
VGHVISRSERQRNSRHVSVHCLSSVPKITFVKIILCEANCAVYCLSSTGYLRTSRIVRVLGNNVVCLSLCASNKGSISTGYESTRLFISAALRNIIVFIELFACVIVATVKEVLRER